MLLYTCIWCNICQCILYLYLNSNSTQTNILYIYIYSENSLFSSAGLKGILQGPSAGTTDTGIYNKSPTATSSATSSTLQNTTSRADFEAALASVEDDEDILAAKGVRSELAKDAEEMNEDEPTPTTTTTTTSGKGAAGRATGDGGEGEEEEEGEGETPRPIATSSSSSSSADAMVSIDRDNPSTTDLTNLDNTTLQKVTEKDENIDSELEFNKWQLSIGANDFITLQNALKPIERYALNYRENIEFYQSLYKIAELQRLESITTENNQNFNNEQWNIEEIEKNKELEELRLFNEGEILAVNLTKKEKSNLQSWYIKERSKLNYNLLYRRMSGDSWCLYIDNLSNIPFWYNNDTGKGYILR